MPSWTARFDTSTPQGLAHFFEETEALRQDHNCTNFFANEDPRVPGRMNVSVDFASTPSETSIVILRRAQAEAVPAVRVGGTGFPSIWGPLQVSRLRPRGVHPDEARAQVDASRERQRQATHRRHLVERLLQAGRLDPSVALESLREIEEAQSVTVPGEPTVEFLTSPHVPPGHIYAVTEPEHVSAEELRHLLVTPFTERQPVGFSRILERPGTGVVNPRGVAPEPSFPAEHLGTFSAFEEEGEMVINERALERLNYRDAATEHMRQQIMAEEDRRIFEAMDRIAAEPGYLQTDRLRVPDFLVSTNPCAEIPLGPQPDPVLKEERDVQRRTRFERLDED